MALVDRTALIDRLRGASTVAVVAPGGSGKSTLIGQLAAALDMPCVRVALPLYGDVGRTLSVLRTAAARAAIVRLADAIDPADPEAALDALASLATAEALLIAFDDVHHAPAGTADRLSRLSAGVDLADEADARRLLDRRRVAQSRREAGLRGASVDVRDRASNDRPTGRLSR